VAVPARRGRSEPGQPGHLAARLRPGVAGRQRPGPALFADYATNLPLYPKLHAYLRDSRVPVLAVWGRNDQIFVPEGALAFAEDAPAAEIHLLDGGHFLLESHLDAAAGSIRRFLDRTLP
jgi:pimeloyl-ACP methyl ester carboxylesterase